jgi:hypothetical protein
MSRKIETCVPQKKVINCLSGQEEIGKARTVCESLKSHGKTLLEVSGRGENEEEETSARKVEKE